jgi:hypothetical protein
MRLPVGPTFRSGVYEKPGTLDVSTGTLDIACEST